MKAFARFIISGQLPAFTVVFGFSLLALAFPLSAIFSGAAIALITLHAGPRNGFLIAGICATALSISTYALFGSAMLGISLAVVQLLPILILASIFNRTQSLSFALQAAAILGAITFILLSLLVPDINQTWEIILHKLLDPIFEARELSVQDGQKLIQLWSTFMSGLLIASTVLMHASIMLMGHWLYCLATESDRFQQEFYRLRLGKVLAICGILLGVLAIMTKSLFAAQLCGIITCLFFLQGMAIVHALTAAMTKGRVWLIITYVLVILIPHALGIIMLAGLTDTFINFRKRV